MIMTNLNHNKLLWVLVVLLSLTALSWVAPQLVPPTSNAMGSKALGTLLILLAFSKVRLIIVHFMEAGSAYPPLRLAFEAWVAIAGGGTLLLYLYL